LIADRYRLTEHIGTGAMGVVWQALDERLHRTVALKQLLLQPGLPKAEANEARERAMREGRIAARLQHPNAVTVYDVVEDEGQPVLIMEYVPSRSLSAVLEEAGSLPPQEVARIGRQVAVALVAAHAAGIVHRDIKPGNVLLADDGMVKITDFGISRATGDVTVTATGMLAGTPAYLAPEVAKGESPGPPSDVWSLGSTLYAAVEGQPPFGYIENTLALLHAVAAGRTNPPRQAGPLTGPLAQMLAPNPSERPTMDEMARTLGAIAAGQLAGIGGPPSGPLAVPTPPRPLLNAPDNRALSEATVRTRPAPQTPPPFRPPAPMGRPTPAGGMAAGRVAAGARSTPPSWRKPVLTAVAIVLAALLGIMVANAFVDTSGDNASAADQGGLAPGETTPQTVMAGDLGPSADAPSTTPAATTAPARALTFQDMQNTLVTFYSMLPPGTSQAWPLLAPAEQAKAGGMAKFQQDWSQVRAVRVSTVLPHDKDSLLATVTLTGKNGKNTTTAAVYTFVLRSGTALISNIDGTGGKGKH
jgi:hypothetical protein